MKIRRGASAALVIVLLVGPPALSQVWAQDTQDVKPGIYTCVDGQGRKLTSDRPIAECRDREQQVLNPSGTVRNVIGPTLTVQERAKQDAVVRQQQDERNRKAEEKRLDRVLLARYPTQSAHDHERASAMAPINDALDAAKQRLQELRAERQKVDGDLAVYATTPDKIPAQLRQQRDDNDQNMAFQQQAVRDQEEEKRRIEQRFNAELEHLRQLWLREDAR